MGGMFCDTLELTSEPLGGHELSSSRLIGSSSSTSPPPQLLLNSSTDDVSYSSLQRGEGVELSELKDSPAKCGCCCRTKAVCCSRLSGSVSPPRRRCRIPTCFNVCTDRINEYWGRRRMQQGVELYNKHKERQAADKWVSALQKLHQRDDKFLLLSYLFQVHMDWGQYREALEYAHGQLTISEELDNAKMRSEACLALSRVHLHMGSLDRALSYARHSLYNGYEQCSTVGAVHLTVGGVYLELAGFHKAFASFRDAHRIAQAVHDSSLELQVYVYFSELFRRLGDVHKSTKYASKAYDMSRSLQLGHLNTIHHRWALMQMAASLRKQGELGDARDYCSEAAKLSLASGDQASYTRSIRIMGDIYRTKCDINRACRQYEGALSSAAAIGDRVVQMESMDGAARCLEALREQHKICNCRPLEFNMRLLEVSSSLGAQLLVRAVRARLVRIYESLGDPHQSEHHARLVHRLDVEFGLRCDACGISYYADEYQPDAVQSHIVLEVLQCGHIIHERCAQLMVKQHGRGVCSICDGDDDVVAATTTLQTGDTVQPAHLNYINTTVYSQLRLPASLSSSSSLSSLAVPPFEETISETMSRV